MSGKLVALAEEQGIEKSLGIPGRRIATGTDMDVFDQGGMRDGLNFMAKASEQAGSNGFFGKDGYGFAMINGAGNDSTAGTLIIGRVKLAGIVRTATSGEPAVKLYQLPPAKMRRRLFDGNLAEALRLAPTIAGQNFPAAKDEDGARFVGKIKGGKNAAGFGDVRLGDDIAAYGSEPRLGRQAIGGNVIIGIIMVNKLVTESGSGETRTKRETRPNPAKMIPAMTAMAAGNRGIGGGLKLSGLDNWLLIILELITNYETRMANE